MKFLRYIFPIFSYVLVTEHFFKFFTNVKNNITFCQLQKVVLYPPPFLKATYHHEEFALSGGNELTDEGHCQISLYDVYFSFNLFDKPQTLLRLGVNIFIV